MRIAYGKDVHACQSVLPRNCLVPPRRSTATLSKKEITHLCQLPILASAYNGACIRVYDDSLLQQHSLMIATGRGQLTVGMC